MVTVHEAQMPAPLTTGDQPLNIRTDWGISKNSICFPYSLPVLYNVEETVVKQVLGLCYFWLCTCEIIYLCLGIWHPSLNYCNTRPLCSTYRFENLRSPKKPVSFKKKIKKYFDPEKLKKNTLKIGPLHFFMYWPGLGSAIKNMGLFSKIPIDFKIETRDL